MDGALLREAGCRSHGRGAMRSGACFGLALRCLIRASTTYDAKLQVLSLLCVLLRDSFKQQLVHQRLRHGFQLWRGWSFFEHALWARLLRILFVASGKVCTAPLPARMRHLGL